MWIPILFLHQEQLHMFTEEIIFLFQPRGPSECITRQVWKVQHLSIDRRDTKIHTPVYVYALMRVYLEQFDTSMVAPSQLRPPQRGVGLSQDLERHRQELTPSTPSLLLQGCQGAQGPKLPLMVWFRSWQRVNSGRFIQELLDSLSWQSV